MNIFRRLPKPNIAQFAFSLVALALFLNSSVAGAQGVDDFVITNFDVDYNITNEHPQGRLDVTESIEVDYSAQNHGIFRAIPAEYQGDSINLDVQSITRDGEAEPYIVYDESGNKVIRIGDPNKYVTGEHLYEIKYTATGVIRFHEDHDEFYWDVNGDQWKQRSLSVSASIKSGSTFASTPAECFLGAFGAADKSCDLEYDSGGVIVSTDRAAEANETLTVAIAYTKGYFTEKPWQEKFRNEIISGVLAVPQLLILRSAYNKWKKYGKDPTKSKTKVPYFGRPEGVSLMQAAYVSGGSIDNKQLTASIVDLAVRGFILIKESKDKKPKHDLTLLKRPDKSVTADELVLLKDLFGSLSKDSHVRLEDRKNKLFKTVVSINKKLDGMSVGNQYFELSPGQAPAKFSKQYVLGLLSLGIGALSSSFIGAPGIGLGAAVFTGVLVLGGLMSKRSLSGDLLKQHYEGLIYYLSKAEKDRLAAFDAVAAPLAARSSQPVRDVKFFEKLLPFAIAGGVEKTWAKAFSDIYTQPPEWFDGKWSNFSTAALASSLGKTTSASGAAFSPPKSSGSSGIGGGGFSGGGGGGGGGGGW